MREQFEFAVEMKGGGGFVFANEEMSVTENEYNKVDVRLFDHELGICRKQLVDVSDGAAYGSRYDEKYCTHRVSYRDIAALHLYREGDFLCMYLVCRNLSFGMYSVFEDIDDIIKRTTAPSPKMTMTLYVSAPDAKGFFTELFSSLKARLEAEGDIYAIIESEKKEDMYQKEVLLGEVGRRRLGVKKDEAYPLLDFITSQPTRSYVRTYTLYPDRLTIGENQGEWVEKDIPLSDILNFTIKEYGMKSLYNITYREGEKNKTVSEIFMHEEGASRQFVRFFENIKQYSASFEVCTATTARGAFQPSGVVASYQDDDGMQITVCKNGFIVGQNEYPYKDITYIDFLKEWGKLYLSVHFCADAPYGTKLVFSGRGFESLMKIHDSLVRGACLSGADFTVQDYLSDKRTHYHRILFLPVPLPSGRIFRGVHDMRITTSGTGVRIAYIDSGEIYDVAYGDIVAISSTYHTNLFLLTKKGYFEIYDGTKGLVSSLKQTVIKGAKKANPEVLINEYNGVLYI